jgi:activator of HSP90 ATPase
MTTTKNIHHVVRFKAKPAAIYQALMDSKKHTAFTGAPARISPAVGGRFTAHGPHLTGVNVDLVKNKRIVQAWRAANWPKGHFSVVTFVLKPIRTGTLLDFTHVGIPAQRVRSINAGWKSHYWEPLKAALKRRSPR